MKKHASVGNKHVILRRQQLHVTDESSRADLCKWRSWTSSRVQDLASSQAVDATSKSLGYWSGEIISHWLLLCLGGLLPSSLLPTVQLGSWANNGCNVSTALLLLHHQPRLPFPSFPFPFPLPLLLASWPAVHTELSCFSPTSKRHTIALLMQEGGWVNGRGVLHMEMESHRDVCSL